jgi:hypothetical protein
VQPLPREGPVCELGSLTGADDETSRSDGRRVSAPGHAVNGPMTAADRVTAAAELVRLRHGLCARYLTYAELGDRSSEPINPEARRRWRRVQAAQLARDILGGLVIDGDCRATTTPEIPDNIDERKAIESSAPEFTNDIPQERN